MPETPTYGQLALVFAATLLFLLSVGFSVARKDHRGLATLFAVAGMLLVLGALVWHAIVRHSWLPLEDNFDALLWLAVIVSGLSLYLQQRRAVGRIDWVASPIVILLLIAAAVLGRTLPQTYSHDLWGWTHRIGVFGGSGALALAASAGAMYLVLSNRLRSKTLPDARFGSLEKLERVTYTAVQVGFALLTVGMITGFAWAVRKPERLDASFFWQPKIITALAAYVLYALVLHSPINPAFRGRRTAILSIAAFVLLLATIGIVQGMGDG